jgi:hypothetical protein
MQHRFGHRGGAYHLLGALALEQGAGHESELVILIENKDALSFPLEARLLGGWCGSFRHNPVEQSFYLTFIILAQLRRFQKGPCAGYRNEKRPQIIMNATPCGIAGRQ